MIILLIVLLVTLGDCSCGDPPPTVVGPGPCSSVVLCVSSCTGTGTGTTSCAPCPAGTFDVSLCSDGGPLPGDAGSCDDSPCDIESLCAYACDEEPFYVGCCECPAGTIDQNSWCGGADAGPDDGGVDGGLDGALDGGPGPGDAGDAGDAGDGGPGTLLAVGEPCFDDRQCASGLCFGAADAMTGEFLPPTCQAMCLPLDDRGFWCRNDRHCCEGTCCVGCGELEGLCRSTP